LENALSFRRRIVTPTHRDQPSGRPFPFALTKDGAPSGRPFPFALTKDGGSKSQSALRGTCAGL